MGRRGVIYIPKSMPCRLGVEDEKRVILEFIPDPFLLAARQKPWARTSVEEFEKESEEEQLGWTSEGSARH